MIDAWREGYDMVYAKRVRRESDTWGKRTTARLFYRLMRRQHGLLLDAQGEPEGGRWNYDRENRAGWRGKDEIPDRPRLDADDITTEVLALVESAFPDNSGDLSQFNFAVTRDDACAGFNLFAEPLAGCLFDDQCADCLGFGGPRLFVRMIVVRRLPALQPNYGQ